MKNIYAHRPGEGTSSTPNRTQVLGLMADPILEGVYRSKLQAADYCTVWCEKGDRWKESLLAFTYDILIVDLSFFQSNPLENLLAIKKLSPESEIIVLSDSEDVRTAINAFKTGIADYFLKPTNPETLAWAIEKICARRKLYSSNESLSADLIVFSAAHHINMSESDEKMRALAVKHLASVMKAQGGMWIWPQLEGQEPKSGLTFACEYTAPSEESCRDALGRFELRFPNLIQTSFDGALTSHPEQWVKGEFAWIPLRLPWMGGVLLYGVQKPPDQGTLARAEFLTRNVEVSLENYRRYVEVKQLTYIDDVTGLYNARYLDIAIEAALEDAKKERREFSVLFIDIDHFKKVNDNHGHLIGSQMLVEMAQVLKMKLRKPDQLFRYGGDEFMAILYGADSRKAIEAAERIRADVEQKRFFIQNKELRITLSIGVATFPEHAKEKSAIIQMADEAMYAGKKNGRNAVFIAGLMTKQKQSA